MLREIRSRLCKRLLKRRGVHVREDFVQVLWRVRYAEESDNVDEQNRFLVAESLKQRTE